MLGSIASILLSSLVVAPGALACDGTETCVANQVLFREASRVYRATLVEGSGKHRFEVDTTWRGEPRDAIELSIWSFEISGCGCQSPLRPDTEYLLLLDCEEPVPAELEKLDCTAYAEFLQGAEHRVRFLDEGVILSRSELIAQLEAWAEGYKTTAEFLSWTGEMEIVAEMEDWQPLPAESRGKFEPRQTASTRFQTLRFESATLEVLSGLGAVLAFADWCPEIYPEIETELKQAVVPDAVELLQSAASSSAESIDRRLRALQERCLEAAD